MVDTTSFGGLVETLKYFLYLFAHTVQYSLVLSSLEKNRACKFSILFLNGNSLTL